MGSSPSILMPGDLAFLLVGCAGTNTEEFANLVVETKTRPNQEPNRTMRKANIPGFDKPVVLIVPPGTEKRHVKDKQVMGQVQQLLRKSRPGDPHVDHILLFPEDPLGVQPAHLANYLEDFSSLCRGTTTSNVFSKTSLIFKDEPGATVQDRDRWEFFVKKGVREYYFRGTKESPLEILKQITTDSPL